MTSIAYAAQLYEMNYASSWVTGFTAFMCFVFVCLGTSKQALKYIKKVDIYCFVGALGAILLWTLTANPIYSIILITLIDALGFMPMLRKAYENPETESMWGGVLAAAKFIPALLALEAYTVTSALYPASLVLTNTAYALCLLMGKKNATLKVL
jgi:hypothetical protein